MQNPESGQPIPFRFSGSGGEYFKIWIVNVLLTLVTLGIFSAWAKVRRERYFYRNTWIGDHAFEYLAEPIEILKGRAIVFSTIFIAMLLIRYHPWIEPVLWFAFMALTPWIIVKSMQFRLRKSAFRNVRFNFDGKLWETAKVYLLWPLLVPLSVGMLLPYVLFLQKRLLVERSRYGVTPFSFHAGPRDFYRLMGVAALIGIIGAGMALGVEVLIPGVGPLGLLLMGLPLVLFLYAFMQAGLQNLVFNHLQLDQNGFLCNLEVSKLLWIILTNVLATVLTAGLFTPWAKVRLACYRAECMVFRGSGELDNFMADQSRQVVSVGEEFGDAFDLDIAL